MTAWDELEYWYFEIKVDFNTFFDYRRCSCRRRITLKHWTTLCLNAFRAFYSSLLLSYIIMASPFALFYTPRVSSPPTTFFFHTHKNLWGVFLGWEESFYKFLQSVVSWPRGRSQLFTSVVSAAVFLFFFVFSRLDFVWFSTDLWRIICF